MPSKLPIRLSYANLMATIAVFIALGGSSYAALRVTGRNVPKDALTGADIKNLTGRDVTNNSLTGADVRNLTSADVANGRLLAEDFAAGSLPKGDKGEPGPLPATLPSGRTLTGAWAIGHDSPAGQNIIGAISYPFPLAASPELHVIQIGATPPPQCPGKVAAPAAQRGHLCIYVGAANDAGTVRFFSVADGDEDGPYTHGAAVYKDSAADLSTFASGTWAVTAP
jgi:hypothetical protein